MEEGQVRLVGWAHSALVFHPSHLFISPPCDAMEGAEKLLAGGPRDEEG